MAAPPYDQEVVVAVPTTAMDTSPISQMIQSEIIPAFLTPIPPSHQDASVRNHLMQDLPSAFVTKLDDASASMHVSLPDLSSSVFMSPMESIDDIASPLRATPLSFVPAFPTHSDTFTPVQPQPLDSVMDASLPDSHHSSVSPPQSQVPSPSIHGTASSYSVGVTSSLESALDPPGSGGRSRANTSVSPGTLPSAFITMPPATQQAAGISFPPTDDSIPGTTNAVVKENAHHILGAMLKDIAITANSAENACRLRHGAETSSKVDELRERISKVSEMIALMSVTTDTSFPPPPFPLVHNTPEYCPVPPVVPISDLHTLNYPPVTSSDLVAAGLLSIHDNSRKRCASELEEHRTVKAPKREPIDDASLLAMASSDALTTLAPEDTQLFSSVVPVVSHPRLTRSRPSSRPPTPPNSFSANGPFGNMKTSAVAGYPPYPSTLPAGVEFTQPTFTTTSPTFPPLHPAWSETVVSSRHHHSLSAGSINALPSVMASSAPLAPGAMDTFPNLPLPPQQLPSSSVLPPATSAISPPLGRMSRSGSITGSFSNPFGYYPPYETATSWPGITRVPPSTPQPKASSTPAWFPSHPDNGALPPAPTSVTPEKQGTARNSPTDEEDDDEDPDSEDNASKNGDHHTAGSENSSNSAAGSDVPQEYRAEVDRIFFEYLNKICSNLEATDSKGEPIHQTLMAKKMQRLDESPDFRPFKFRIQAFTLAFLDELASQGYPEDKIPMKKIRNYLWRQQYILRFNEDGKKAKSKGNHIWNIEAKKAGDGKWEFRPFHRKIAGSPPGVAYCGLRWSWTPRVWDPQASWQNVPVEYSSPSLPSWLSWKDDVLSGVPPPDAETYPITINAKFVLDGQEGHLSHTFTLTIAPMSTGDTTSFSNSRRPSFAGEPPRRSTSDSVLFASVQQRYVPQPPSGSSSSNIIWHTRTKPRPPAAATQESADTRVIRVLQSVAQRVTEEAASQFVSASPPQQGDLQDLVKQKHVLEQTVNAYDKEISGQSHTQTRRLAVAAQNVVIQAAHSVIADRSIANGSAPPVQSESSAVQSVTVGELSDATQDAIAMAVKRKGTASTEVDIIVTATSILKARTPGSPTALIDSATNNLPLPPARVHPVAGASARLLPSANSNFPSQLPSLSEYP